MFRILALLIALPTYAAADWSTRPAMFTFDATFDLCTQDPTAPDLAATCADVLEAAYVLKRAVAIAAFTCHPEDLTTCAIPFEDEGLPHIAMRIAVDVGCTTQNDRFLPNGVPYPEDHCITVASDIMIDEGVVPLFTEISCGPSAPECIDLARLNADLWSAEIDKIVPNDPTIANLQDQNLIDCIRSAQSTRDWIRTVERYDCMAKHSATIWSDLNQQAGQDQ